MVSKQTIFPIRLGFMTAFLGGELLCHEHQELPVTLIGPTQEPTEPLECPSILTSLSPDRSFAVPTLQRVQELGRFLTVIKELIERHVHCPRQFLQCFDRWNRMAVFYSGDVATQKTSALFNIALREILLHAKCTQTIRDNHINPLTEFLLQTGPIDSHRIMPRARAPADVKTSDHKFHDTGYTRTYRVLFLPIQSERSRPKDLDRHDIQQFLV